MFKEDYVPTEKDVLQTRLETLGVQEHEFPVGEKNVLKIVDVGGSKSQRFKWLQQFIHCNAVIFIVAMNGYCQYMAESPTTLRIHDSMALFDVIINNQYLKHVAVILFLNKRDLFKRMLKVHPITIAYPDYSGK